MAGTQQFESPQWRDANKHKSYPFTDSSTLVSDTGELLLDSAFIDARLYIPGLTGRVSLLRVTVAQDSISVVVGSSESDEADTATAVIDLANTKPIAVLRTQSGRIVGTLLSGSSTWFELILLGLGEHTFGNGVADFVPAVVNYVPATLSRLLGPDNEELGDIVRLVGEEGVRLECDAQPDLTTVRVHVTGDPLYQLTACDVDSASANQVIERVVFQAGDQVIECAPNSDGLILIVPDTFDKSDSSLRINPESDGLKFTLAGKSLEAR